MSERLTLPLSPNIYMAAPKTRWWCEGCARAIIPIIRITNGLGQVICRRKHVIATFYPEAAVVHRDGLADVVLPMQQRTTRVRS
jgi:hypothetical protein